MDMVEWQDKVRQWQDKVRQWRVTSYGYVDVQVDIRGKVYVEGIGLAEEGLGKGEGGGGGICMALFMGPGGV